MRVRLAECGLVIATTVLTCLAGELAFALLGLRHVPLRLHADLPEDVRIFAQSSKAGVVPRDPIILLGDSYAQGVGDWLYVADPSRNGPFHSAHVIHDLTRRDVVTLGKAGAGSAEAMAALPAAAFGDAARAWLLRLPSPKVAVVYFYEGNDLNNNMSFLARRVGDSAVSDDDVARIDHSIAAYASAVLPDPGWWRHLPLLRFSYSLARRVYAEQTSPPEPEPEDYRSPEEPEEPNLVEVAGETVPLPGALQSPALELTPAEVTRTVLVFERSLAFLRGLLGGTPVMVVYVPSPLSSYRLSSPEVSIQPYLTGRDTRYPKNRIEEHSNRICALIRAATIRQGAGFLDVRPAVRAASAYELMHGPDDFRHFNREGMEVLGTEVAERIERPLLQEPCGDP